MNLISKEEAKKIQQKWYFTGNPCKNNHVDKRYVNTGICYSCKRIQNKNSNKRNPEKNKIRSRKYYNNCSKQIRNLRSLNWSRKNREKSNAIKNKYYLNNKSKILKKASEYNKIQRQNPFKRLSKNTSKSIWECLNGKKNYNKWLTFVDFTLEELIVHLESKFDEKMTWENYGSYWHLDHIKPLSWFNLENEFKEAWSLNNLQPLEAKLNLSKCNRYEG